MQTKIAFVLLFSLRTISLAADVTVYDFYDYIDKHNAEPVAVSQFPWKFACSWNKYFFIGLYIRNKSPSVTTVNVKCQSDDRSFEVEKSGWHSVRNGDEYLYIGNEIFLKSSEIKIWLNLYTSNMLCSSLLVAKGRAVANIADELLYKEFPYYNTSSNDAFALVVDLINICDGPPLVTETKINKTTENAGTDVETINPNNNFTSNSSTNLETTTHKNSAIDTNNSEQLPSYNLVLLLYVILSVIGMCIIILVIYLLWAKKCCHRNSPPVATIELNTFHHEPFYLNMLFRRECDQEIADIEQHYYEEIGPQVTDSVTDS